MTTSGSEFIDAAKAIAEERYGANFSRGFAHLALQLSYPTFSFTDDQAEELIAVDRKGDLGCDGILISDEEQQILLFQAKSSSSISESDLHDKIATFISVPSKLQSDEWVARAHAEMKSLANEFRTAARNDYQIQYAFATGSAIGSTVRSTFESLSEAPGTSIHSSIHFLDAEELANRYRRLLLGEHGRSTDVELCVREDQLHMPSSVEPVVYVTIPAHEFIGASKKYGMELFRYNPRLYLGSNKVNTSIEATLKSDPDRNWFHLLNNGITAVCNGFEMTDPDAGRTALRTDGGPRRVLLRVEDFQVVNGCQTTMTLFENSDAVAGIDDCLVDLKIIRSPGLRDLISQATNTQTAILAEDAFSNELEQRKIQELFARYNPRYFYAPKRGSWERLSSTEKRQYQIDVPVAGRHRKVTSKELAAACLAVFGEPEAAKDKPRIVFEKVGGKKVPYYERIFKAQNVAAQWLLPFEILRNAHALVKQEEARDPDSDRARIGAYGRYRMLHLAYGYLRERDGGGPPSDTSDFLDAPTSEKLLKSISKWGPNLLAITLDALVDGLQDAQARGVSSGLREFFREKKHQPMIKERFDKALQQNARVAERGGQTLQEYLGFE